MGRKMGTLIMGKQSGWPENGPVFLVTKTLFFLKELYSVCFGTWRGLNLCRCEVNLRTWSVTAVWLPWSAILLGVACLCALFQNSAFALNL